MNKTYCTQNLGNCYTCSLVNYGRDCRNNPVAPEIADGYCTMCGTPVIYCIHSDNHHNSLAARLNADMATDKKRISMDETAKFFAN